MEPKFLVKGVPPHRLPLALRKKLQELPIIPPQVSPFPAPAIPDSVNFDSLLRIKNERGSGHVVPMEYPSMALQGLPAGPVSEQFPGAFKTGFLSIFYAIENSPLEMWEKQLRAGSLRRIIDYDIRSPTIELTSNNIVSTFITCPPSPCQTLGIKLPICVLVVKNIKRYFMFETQILDDTKARRRFRVSTSQPLVKIGAFACLIPLNLEDGWNQIVLNLSEMTRKTFGTGYSQAVRIQVHANCRLRRIYFCEKMFSENDVPADFKQFLVGKSNKENDVNEVTPPPRLKAEQLIRADNTFF